MGRRGDSAPPKEKSKRTHRRWQPFWRLRRRQLRGEDFATELPADEHPPLPRRGRWLVVAVALSFIVWVGVIYALARWVL